MKKLMFFSMLLFFAVVSESRAQISAGVQQLSSATFASIGTDPDNKMFGEARVSTGRRVGIEGTFGYNFVQKDEVNFYSGFHLGTEGNRDGVYLGIPLGVLVKPFSNTRNFGFLLEASPIFPTEYGNYFRAGIGMKYTFR
ncbi:outer membrane insertion C- signal [Belliella kenyensis]|uniref:Outer membrane insertion C- signal n=1 Tax=Belliella kenyensis TaxID=1472724 RepID=A0ABV8ESN1_9BACT|nr:outer membrane insertion C- signal [Belliella kenyensis]MCH7402527.1 outer membrane insertion C- signal [Belliella kenyensis]MDN3603325.1 outer membrane insertion C- signal [Belliella kenyensis]